MIWFLLVLMGGRAAYEFTGSYDHDSLAWFPDLDEVASFHLVGREPQHQAMTIRDILKTMKVNFWPFDKTTNVFQKVMQGAPTHRTINAYLLALFLRLPSRRPCSTRRRTRIAAP